MKICFCLLGASRKPIGGYKVVFEYANRLTNKGHEITLVLNKSDIYLRYNLPSYIIDLLCNYIIRTFPKWFNLNKKVKKIFVNDISDNTIPDGDIIIATAVQTAEKVYNLSNTKGKKLYFIQGFENWVYSDEKVFNTYQLDMKKIVISKGLKHLVDSKSSTPSVHIPNGIDFNVFDIDVPIEERNPHSIAMLYHTDNNKGSELGLKVIATVKKLFPDLEVRIFGVPKRPKELPKWIKYTHNATQKELRKIYNHSAVFLSTSINEAFGLTAAESMACGCALVSTAYLGVFEYAVPEKNSLISSINNKDELVNNIKRLFTDNDMRIKIAKNGVLDIKKLSWESSIDKFEKILFE